MREWGRVGSMLSLKGSRKDSRTRFGFGFLLIVSFWVRGPEKYL